MNKILSSLVLAAFAVVGFNANAPAKKASAEAVKTSEAKK